MKHLFVMEFAFIEIEINMLYEAHLFDNRIRIITLLHYCYFDKLINLRGERTEKTDSDAFFSTKKMYVDLEEIS